MQKLSARSVEITPNISIIKRIIVDDAISLLFGSIQLPKEARSEDVFFYICQRMLITAYVSKQRFDGYDLVHLNRPKPTIGNTLERTQKLIGLQYLTFPRINIT